MYNFEPWVPMINQGQHLRTLTYLELSFVKSLPLFIIETHGSKIYAFLYFYSNIVCKKRRNYFYFQPFHEFGQAWFGETYCGKVLRFWAQTNFYSCPN